MKLSRCSLALVLLESVALFQNVAAAPDESSPVTVTQAVYRSALDHFGFTPETVKAQKERLAPELYSRLLKKANEPAPKDAAPDIEGDLFLNCQEPPNTFEIGKSTIDQTKAKVDVTLVWPGEKRHYTVLLKQVDGAWKVYDVNYGKDGNLTDLLN